MRAVRHLPADRRANAGVELALTLPIFLVLLVGAFEIAATVFVAGTLEGAVLAASRYGATGQGAAAGREARIRSIIAERTLGLVDMDTVTVKTTVYPSFAAIGGVLPPPPTAPQAGGGSGTPAALPGVPGLGGSEDIVLYDVTYDTVAMTAIIAPLFGALHHHVAVALRNEPY